MGRAIASVFEAQIVFFVAILAPDALRAADGFRQAEWETTWANRPRTTTPLFTLRGPLNPTIQSASRPAEFRPKEGISLIASEAYARTDCSRAFPSQPRCRPTGQLTAALSRHKLTKPMPQ